MQRRISQNDMLECAMERLGNTRGAHLQVSTLLSLDKEQVLSKRCMQYYHWYNVYYIGAIARGNAFFGQGVGSIVIDDAQCTGSESALIACKNTTMHNCGHSEDAGVECPG